MGFNSGFKGLTLVLESMNGQLHTRFRSYIQKEYKRISHIQNDKRQKSGTLGTSNPCQSIEKLSKFRCIWFGECRCAPLQLDVTRLADGYTHTTKELVCPSVGGERDTTAVQSAFQSQFDKGPCSRYCIYVGCKTFGQEMCICEGKCASVPLCVWCNCAVCLGFLSKQLTKINAPGSFRAALYAKCTLHSCFGLFVCQMQSTSTCSLWGMLRG